MGQNIKKKGDKNMKNLMEKYLKERSPGEHYLLKKNLKIKNGNG